MFSKLYNRTEGIPREVPMLYQVPTIASPPDLKLAAQPGSTLRWHLCQSRMHRADTVRPNAGRHKPSQQASSG